MIAIIPSDPTMLAKAQALAKRLQLPLSTNHQAMLPVKFLLTVTPDHLELRENLVKNAKPLVVDFLSPRLDYRIKHGGGKNQLLAKAVGVKNKKNLTVIDATAGFGIDAFILATLGCEVTMIERSPIIYALLEDGLARYRANLKINLKCAQSLDYLNNLVQNGLTRPDVIYLDPMYPKRSKSALNRKTMRILHDLVGEDNDAPKLLEIALKCATNRVVVKRPKAANYLGEIKPNLQFFSSGSSRFDVYLCKELGK